MQQPIRVEDWVAMFRELGLDDAQMKSWHRIFESRHPEAHLNFLQWLGIPENEIERIRSESR